MVIPQQRSCCVLQLARKRCATAQLAFCTQFYLVVRFHVQFCVNVNLKNGGNERKGKKREGRM
jgi:hypothetical protein